MHVLKKLFPPVMGIVLLLAGCSGGDSAAPARPTGLSATPGSSQVFLSWKPNTEEDVTHYSVYGGANSANLNLLDKVPQGTESYTATGLENGTTYSFAIDAEDKSGNKSARSNTVVATPTEQTVGVWDASTWDNAVWAP